MSVLFNHADHNLGKIDNESKLYNFTTKGRYRIYGLKHEDENPPIWITLGTKVSPAKFKPLVSFLEHMGFTPKLDTDKGKHPEKFVPRQVSIGLRRDVRNKVVMSACLVQTIVYFAEGKVTLRNGYKVPGLPKY